MSGVAALPRRNGELVFAAPWEGRLFGMTVQLQEQKVYTWSEFRDRLISELNREDSGYYAHWQEALERLLTERGVLNRMELEDRREDFQSQRRTEVY